MGASDFTYVEATWTQALGDWIGTHTRAFRAIGGAPRLIVPDNAKVAVIRACLYEPQINRTYAEMAAHYGTAVLPTRPRRPRDKALPTAISANRSRSASLLKYRPGAGLVTLPAPCRRAPAPLAARLLRLRRARTRCEAAIDHNLRTGHVARCVGGEE